MNKTKMDWDEYVSVLNECKELAFKKNKAYGSESLTATGIRGIYVRLIDKVYRLQNLVESPETDNLGESIEDTLKDIINYSAYGVVMQRDKL